MASLTTSDFSSEEAICKEVAITILNNHYNAQSFLTWKAREDVGRIGSLYNRTFTVKRIEATSCFIEFTSYNDFRKKDEDEDYVWNKKKQLTYTLKFNKIASALGIDKVVNESLNVGYKTKTTTKFSNLAISFQNDFITNCRNRKISG